MIFGLSFTNDSKQQAQFSIDVAKKRLWFRANNGAGWTDWKRADVDRNSDGSLSEVAENAIKADRALKADAFTYPVTVTFTGGVSGSMVIDGSRRNMEVNLDTVGTIDTAGGLAKVIANNAIIAHEERYHSPVDSSGD